MAKTQRSNEAGRVRPRPDSEPIPATEAHPPGEPRQGGRPPDPRELEAHQRQFLEGLGLPAGAVADTPLGRSQQIMRQAHELDDPGRQAELARKALEACPDCADAYVMLAELAGSPAGAIPLFEQGVAAGERAMDQRAFLEDVGQFGGILETRPYMRARFGLARALGAIGRLDEAIEHDWDLLRLNSRDNQGVRYHLAGALLDRGRLDDLVRLVEQFEDEASPTWAYTKALLAFRREGDSEAARARLAEARAINPHVPAQLLGEAAAPVRPEDSADSGDEDEAADYAAASHRHWRAAPGALDWLRQSGG